MGKRPRSVWITTETRLIRLFASMYLANVALEFLSRGHYPVGDAFRAGALN